MKLSRKALMLLGVGILVVAFVSLGLTYLKQANELHQLDDELFLAEQKLNSIEIKELSAEEASLQKRLSQLDAQLQSNPVKVELSQTVLSTDTTDELFDIAELCGVEIYSISSSGVSDGQLEELPCSSLPVTITAQGDVSNLITYVTRLNDDFTNGTVQTVVIQVPPPPSADDDEEEEENDINWFQDQIPGYDIPLPNQIVVDENMPAEPTASIQMIIYFYEDGQ